uniref:Spermatogenesis associated 22 n=1 Tax=Junco hyemalis TaxID=40217 RepID=A0A8C5IHT3_JUNHY
MKRSLADTPARSTAGCLPVPLFNQKKRTRQPLTSNPLKNEPDTGSGTHSYDFSPSSFGKTANSRSDNGTSQKFENFPSSLKTVQQQNHPNSRNPSQLIKTDTPKGKWPVKPNTVARNLQDQSPAYKFNYKTQQNKMNENQFGGEISSSQVKTKIKKNSLRILSAVIQSVRHWSQYAYKTALLFEVLGTLDSAVTPGAYGAKNFLLRDGKETLPCVFYEIDRELPRLIRGRVHRCMGTYDAKKNIFKCVSVRPATAQEQNTFQDFVKVADVEMTAYVKTMNEM